LSRGAENGIVRRLIGVLGRVALSVVVLVVGAGLAGAWLLQRWAGELPDYAALAEYAPPTVTRIHAGDGRLLAEYAREKRVFVPIEAIPDRVKHAFIAAEDKNFYRHPGIDVGSIVRAAITNIEHWGTGQRPQGASTITQQVAKNFFVGNELSLTRKVREALLALRMERAFTKDHILELYLNEIFLGNRSYGVAAAALNYFDKSLDELTLGEAAFLAALPKAPSRYDPSRDAAAAIGRRNYVLGRMHEDGYIDTDALAEARAEPLTLRSRPPTEFAQADFFTETVRRQLVARFGEAGFYEGGLSVRTTVQPRLQQIADRALRHGLAAYDQRQGWRGPLGRIETAAAGTAWQAALAGFDPGFELMDWRLAVVLEAGESVAELGFADGSRGELRLDEITWARRVGPNGRPGPAVRRTSDVVAAGDVVAVEWLAGADGAPGRWTLRQRPEVEGAVVALDPHTGRVLALSGGFSFRQSQFDRATQALRQPGSAFKPFVYLAALERGYTPASIIVDGPIEIDLGPGVGVWRPKNYSDRYYGPSTLRVGLEKSRNLMTIRLAQEVGMDSVVEVARRFGIDRGLQPYLAGALGAGEVDLLSLTRAYAMLVNGGRWIEPAFVERIQDRHGRTVLRRDDRPCPDCLAVRWQAQAAPVLPDARPLIEDPRYAYQIVNMLTGVIERGTAAQAARLGRPLAGKTGTTNDAKDAWFIGFSPDLVVGVWVGYDQPRSLGDRETGGSVALPIWIEVMEQALAGQARVPFRTPPGVTIVRVDAKTGRLPSGGDVVIAEAFIPGTEPRRETAGDAQAPRNGRTAPAAAAGGGATLPGGSGLY
jgi:penicillin-binding protein 1A